MKLVPSSVMATVARLWARKGRRPGGGSGRSGSGSPCWLLVRLTGSNCHRATSPGGGNVLGNLGEHGYAIRVPKAFNTHDGFQEYMKSVLIPCLCPTAERPVLILTVGHRSRVDLEAIRFAREHHIHLFLLPAHTTHFLCPLDPNTHCFRPMKQVFANSDATCSLCAPMQVR